MIYSQNVAIAARRVQDLVRDVEQPAWPVNAVFLGAVAARIMESIQLGQMQALTALDDAAAYHALADLIVAGVTGTNQALSSPSGVDQ